MTKITIILLSLLSFIPASCASPKVVQTSGETRPAEATNQAPAKPAWQIRWDKTLAEAQREGRVTVYSSGGTEGARETLSQTLKDRFNLKIDITTARGAEISNKLQTERRAGLYMVDVYIGAAKRLVQTDKPTGALDPLEPALILPQVLDGEAWWGGKLRWVDRDRTIFAHSLYVNAPMLINTNLARTEEFKSFRGLLNPKWRGKIVLDDPSMGGSTAATIFALGDTIMGWDFVRQLVQQNPVIVRDRRLILEWIAQGKYPISMMTTGADEFIKAGAPVEEIIPDEGTYLSTGPGSVALINKAPHPQAAKIFINWLLSKEGQTLHSQATGNPSARVDAPKEMFDSRKIPRPGVKYVLTDTEEYLFKRIHFEEVSVREIFGPLLK